MSISGEPGATSRGPASERSGFDGVMHPPVKLMTPQPSVRLMRYPIDWGA